MLCVLLTVKMLDLHITLWQRSGAMGQMKIDHSVAMKARVAPGWLGFTLALFVSLAASSAVASNTDSKEKLARKACLAGDYAKGVAILADLFVDTRDATHVFNQGRCFEQNGRHEEAINRFREYLRIATKLSDADAALAQKHISDCQTLLGKENTDPAQRPAQLPVAEPSKKEQPASPPARRETSGSPIAVPPQPEAALQKDTPSAREHSPGAGARTAGVIVAAVGGAALITGVALNLKVNSMTSDLEVSGAYSRSAESRRASYATMAWISYGGGGACVAAGAVLYLLGWKSWQAGSTSLALLPVISQDGGGAVIQGAF
jgi:tetratricopeptide (TPR) repeat protein